MLKFDSNGIDEYENVYESLPKIYDPTVHLLAGAMAGIMEHSIMYPIDSVKVIIKYRYLSLMINFGSI